MIYTLAAAVQLIFYIAACTGWRLAIRNIRIPILYVCFYFAFMNFCVFAGFYRFLNKSQSVIWHKAARKTGAA
jgi:poly-beta-1,6-N-acetyl-D-glucosamine synthase